jgi:hypothetical protein
MRIVSLLSVLFLSLAPALAQTSSEPLGIALEGYPYPFPVRFLPLTVERHAVRLAYMDVPPDRSRQRPGRPADAWAQLPGLLLGTDH